MMPYPAPVPHAMTAGSIAAAFCAVHRILVKGGLFLAIGMVALTKSRGLWPVVLPAVVLALGLGGAPSDRRRIGELGREGAVGRRHRALARHVGGQLEARF